jgi:hypothetical protein
MEGSILQESCLIYKSSARSTQPSKVIYRVTPEVAIPQPNTNSEPQLVSDSIC